LIGHPFKHHYGDLNQAYRAAQRYNKAERRKNDGGIALVLDVGSVELEWADDHFERGDYEIVWPKRLIGCKRPPSVAVPSMFSHKP